MFQRRGMAVRDRTKDFACSSLAGSWHRCPSGMETARLPAYGAAYHKDGEARHV